jgi:uncharacterized protein YjiS (DUF1127 family)
MREGSRNPEGAFPEGRPHPPERPPAGARLRRPQDHAEDMTMSALDRSATAIDLETAAGPIAGLRRLARALANRRQLGPLRDLSDRGLADIGLMRLDLDFVRRAPFSVDPTMRLASVAQERTRPQDAARS